ncbi:MAG: hypothetical protein COB02_11030 [Candidatus Cloacimonadota bacterium]|nr:MAG: hypothetical protein COB02_11030 [Candidatus Cloacimonadota bacterium]
MKTFLFFISFLLINKVYCDPSLIHDELILKDEFSHVIKNSITFFQNRQNTDGSFIYDVLPFTGKTIYKGNMVRQAGTLFSLAFSYDGKDKNVKRLIDNSLQYFLDNVKEFNYQGKSLMVISENNESLTGTICLFLSSFFYLHSQYKEQFPVNNKAYVGLMNTLEEFSIIEGGITEYINTEENYMDRLGRGSEIYATAQHFLTLSLFHYAFKRKKMTTTLSNYINLYDRKWVYGDLIPSYQWVMLSYLFLSRQNFSEYKWQIINSIENLQSAYQYQIPIKYIKRNYCTQLEGFSYYLQYKQEHNELNRFLFYRLTKHLRYSQNFQIKSNTKKVISKVETFLKKPLQTVGGFWNKKEGIYHTRIDYTQHCLSAYQGHHLLANNMSKSLEEYEKEIELARIQQIEQDAYKKIEFKRMNRVIPKIIPNY